MEMVCPKCKAQVEESYNYCPICGEPLSELGKQSESIKLSTAGYMKLNDLANVSGDPAVLDAIKKLLTNE